MKTLCRSPRLNGCGGKSFVSCFLALALSSGCQIDYPTSTDFPNESAPIEAEMTTEARLASQDGELCREQNARGSQLTIYTTKKASCYARHERKAKSDCPRVNDLSRLGGLFYSYKPD